MIKADWTVKDWIDNGTKAHLKGVQLVTTKLLIQWWQLQAANITMITVIQHRCKCFLMIINDLAFYIYR